MAEPTNVMAGVAGFLEGLTKALQMRQERQRQTALDKAQQIASQAQLAHQKTMEGFEKERIDIERDKAKSNAEAQAARLSFQQAVLDAKIHPPKDATLANLVKTFEPGARAAYPDNIYLQQQAATLAAQEVMNAISGTPSAGQPQAPQPLAPQAPPPPVMSTLGSGRIPSPIQTPQIPFGGTPPIAPQMQQPFNPLAQLPPGQSLQGAQARAADVRAQVGQATIPKIQEQVKNLTLDEQFKQIRNDTEREYRAGKITKLQAEAANDQARHELILAQTNAEKAHIELVGAQTRLTNAKAGLVPLEKELAKARIQVERERASNPGLGKNEKWLASQNRELGQTMSTIIAKQEPFIKAINSARGKVAAFEQVLRNPLPAPPDPQNAAAMKEWLLQKNNREYAASHLQTMKDEIAENEQLNRQLEAEKARVNATLTDLGMQMLRNGRPSTKDTEAVKKAAEAEAKKKEAEAKKHSNRAHAAPRGVAPMPINQKDLHFDAQGNLIK